MHAYSGSTGSVPLRTSSRRSHASRVARSAHSRGRETLAAQDFARALGAAWAGGSDERPPFPLDAAIIFAPVGALVPAALAAVRKGGTVVCGGIHMSDIPSFPYARLWGERRLVSVANLTRRDGDELLALAPHVAVRTEIQRYALADANAALAALRAGAVRGAAVLVME
jgi:propanol-preferring alcohol dehydrogenase